MNKTNPLLEESGLINGAPRFDLIRLEHFLPAIKVASANARKNIAAIKNNPNPPSFENTCIALETSLTQFNDIVTLFYNSSMTIGVGSKAWEKTEARIGKIYAELITQTYNDHEICKRLETLYNKRETLKLNAVDARLLEQQYESFIASGAKFSPAKKKRLADIAVKISELAQTYGANVNNSAERYKLYVEDEARLSGLGKLIISNAKDAAIAASQNGSIKKYFNNKASKTINGHLPKAPEGTPQGFLFNLDYATYMAIISHAEDRALRKEVWLAWENRGSFSPHDNREIALEIIKLRDEEAKIHGHKNYAAYQLTSRMAEKPEIAIDFLEKLRGAYKKQSKIDLKALENFAAKDHLEGGLMPWDVKYYADQYELAHYDFSKKHLEAYFPLEHTLDGTLEHFNKLFGVRFVEDKTLPVWHEDVKAFNVLDAKSGKLLATFYADFFSRQGKSEGGWTYNLRDGGLDGGKIKAPIVMIACDFTKPSSDMPSLLTHEDVTTLFHEMGHAMHVILSKVKYKSLAGFNVAWDFVEMPSQLQENWVYEPQTLKLISKHYQTGETLPLSLIQKLDKVKNNMQSYTRLRRTDRALLDLRLHSVNPKAIGELDRFEDRVLKSTQLFPRVSAPQSTNFSHIFSGGYDAGFYSYKWSEFLAADIFERFKENGIYSAKTAKALKEKILSRGGSAEPSILFKNFMGREPDNSALLRREGLLPPPASDSNNAKAKAGPKGAKPPGPA